MERILFFDHVSDAHLRIWEINHAVHERGVELIKPGARCGDIARELNKIYVKHGLLKYRTIGYGHSFGALSHYYGREAGKNDLFIYLFDKKISKPMPYHSLHYWVGRILNNYTIVLLKIFLCDFSDGYFSIGPAIKFRCAGLGKHSNLISALFILYTLFPTL